jgi:hypothetical protein
MVNAHPQLSDDDLLRIIRSGLYRLEEGCRHWHSEQIERLRKAKLLEVNDTETTGKTARITTLGVEHIDRLSAVPAPPKSRNPFDVLKQRIEHHNAAADSIEELFAQFSERLDRETKGGQLSPETSQALVQELEKIERMRAANRAVVNELECLRVLLEG